MTSIRQKQNVEVRPMEAVDLLVSYLEQIGVEFVFGVPGGAIEPLYNALARSARRGGPRPVVARHETGAAFMADGYARETGKIGVCCATAGPGSTNLLTGVACAHENEIPLLLITGQPALRLLGRGAMQEAAGMGGIDTVAMFRTCTRYSALVSHPDQLERQLANALLSARQPTPGPVHLSIPLDVQRSPLKNGPAYDLVHLLRAESAVDDIALRELQVKLAQAKRVVVLVGCGCGEAIDLVIEWVERTGAAFVVAPDAKGLISPHHPLYRGVFGFAGHSSAVAAMDDKAVDLVLAVGSALGEWTSNGWSESLLNRRLVHVDARAAHLMRSPMACLHVRGNIRRVFERLLQDRGGDAKATSVGEKRRLKNVLADDPFESVSAGAPIRPQRLMRELGMRCPPETRFLADAGNSAAWAIHCLSVLDHRPSVGGWLRVTMNFAPMGWAIGGAVGTALANREVPVVCITGDGSLLMNGQEMSVALTENLSVLFVILNDGALGMVKHGQRLAGAERIGFELPAVDFRLMAESMGITAHVVRTAGDLDRLDLDAILRHPGPTVLDVRIDREEVPPIGLRMKILAAAK